MAIPAVVQSQPSGSITVGTSATRVLTRNDRRSWAVLVNDSTQDIYVGISRDVGLNAGIRLNSQGGTLILGPDTDMPWTGEVWAITTPATATLTVVEANREEGYAV